MVKKYVYDLGKKIFSSTGKKKAAPKKKTSKIVNDRFNYGDVIRKKAAERRKKLADLAARKAKKAKKAVAPKKKPVVKKDSPGTTTRKINKSRNTKGKRTDLARERAEKNLNKRKVKTSTTPVRNTKVTKPPQGPGGKKGPNNPKPPKNPKKGRNFGPETIAGGAGVIAGYLAKDNVVPIQRGGAAPKPGNKSNAPNPFNNRNKSSARKAGPSGPSMTSMRAPSTGPKPRNKNVTKRPKGPSKQGSFGRQMRASRGMGIINPKKCCSKVLSKPSTCASKSKRSYKKGGTVKDACYKKVKASYKVFPSAYASGAIAKCRKKGK